MYRNILVSIDGSTHSDQALREAIDIANCTRARLTLLTAVPSPTGWAVMPISAATVIESLATELEQESQEILRRAVNRVPGSIPVRTILTHDPIRIALQDQIATDSHDLLVMGSRGRGAITASLLGSVSHFALNHCTIPVLIVHADGEAQAELSEPRQQPAVVAGAPLPHEGRT
jgi:nucleotide-binding universal stress UspA family protein